MKAVAMQIHRPCVSGRGYKGVMPRLFSGCFETSGFIFRNGS